MDQLRTVVDELKSQVLQSKTSLDVKIQKFTEKVANLMKQNETDKNTLGKQLKSALEDFNEMSKNFDEERKKNTALRHDIATHQIQLQERDRQLKTLSSEKQYANSTLTQIKGELAETKRAIQTHEQTIATASDKLQQSEKELQRVQGVIRDHERQAATTATELQRLRGYETQFNASRVGESDQLKTANDQIRQKDDEIRKISADLANTKSELSKLQVEYAKAHKLAHEQMNVIDGFTQEKKALEEDLRRLNGGSSRMAEPARNLSQATFSLQTRRGGPPGDDDGNYPDTYAYAPHDTDDHGDQASVHFAHLMARLRELVGEKPSNEIVSELVNVFIYHVKNPKDQQALLKRIIPGYTPSRNSMEFGNYLYDYLFRHDSSSSVHYQLRRLLKEGSEDGIEV
jgi:myosin heavy subunit